MRPWRDVVDHREFKQLIENKEYVADSAAVNVFGSSRKSHLEKVYEALHSYHAIAKHVEAGLLMRANELQKVSTLAGEWFAKFKIDPATVQRNLTRKIDQRSAGQVSLDRNMLTLQRRALRKRDYLLKLHGYCTGTRTIAEFVDIINERVPQPTDGGGALLGVGSHNMKEVEDFAHRDYSSTALDDEVRAWLATDRGIHFFLWLEGRPFCTSQNKTAIADATQVRYANTAPPAVLDTFKFKVAYFDTTANLIKNGDGGQPITTYGSYRGGGQKSVGAHNPWGEGLAAFVLGPQYELIIGAHLSGKFHHSSLLSAGMVRCAGMIGIRGGRIEEISNNSGHYQPRWEHMYAAVQYFRAAFTTPTTILIHAGPVIGNRRFTHPNQVPLNPPVAAAV